MSRPFAVFDIDGTIIRWQLFHAIFDALANNRKLSPEIYEQIKSARKKWKTRTHTESFREHEAEVVRIFETLLKGMEVTAYTQASHDVFEEYKDQVYRYTRNLIQKLKKDGYLLFAISGSPREVVAPFAEYYGFDDFVATEHLQKNGLYTGEIELAVGHRKNALLKSLVEKHNSSLNGSIGVGDSEGDIAMLELVQNPIAFNPSKKLFEHAKANHWRIVVERKNMTYELQEIDGTYVLQ